MICQTTSNDVHLYREEINNISQWCSENNLLLIISKNKDLMLI